MLSLADGRIKVEEVPRKTAPEQLEHLIRKYKVSVANQAGTEAVTPARRTSSDLRVCDPCKLVLELQARSIYGSQDTLFGKNLMDDLERLGSGRADVFILACDAPIYEAILGNRGDRRGRKPILAPIDARQVFPSIETLPLEPHQITVCGTGSSLFGNLHRYGCRTRAGVAVERVILAIWTVEPTLSGDQGSRPQALHEEGLTES